VHSFPDRSSGFHARFTPFTVAGQLPIYTAFPFSSPRRGTMTIVKEQFPKPTSFFPQHQAEEKTGKKKPQSH
jgi:hypothetical protein